MTAKELSQARERQKTMIAEAIEKLRDMTLRAATPMRLEIADPTQAVFVINGTDHPFNLPVPPRQHKAGTLVDLIALANRFRAETDDGDHPVVWFNSTEVLLVMDDDGYRQDKIVLSLTCSDVFKRVKNLGGQEFDQKAFVKLLRIDLATAIAPVELLEKVRRIKFENGVTVAGTVARDRESLGREITSRVELANGEIPEEVTLSIPVYSTRGLAEYRYSIRCSVEVDSTRGVFRLAPFPDELTRVQAIALEDIQSLLTENLDPSIPAYNGSAE